MIGRRIQFSIGTLLLTTFICAVFVRLWPWRLATATQLILAAWTTLTLTQVPLLTWVWAGAPISREKRRVYCYSIALPCCVLPIANWLICMLAITAEQDGVYLLDDMLIGFLAIFLLISTFFSLIVLPSTFALYWGIRRDPAFWVLRLLGCANLLAPLVVAAI